MCYVNDILLATQQTMFKAHDYPNTKGDVNCHSDKRTKRTV